MAGQWRDRNPRPGPLPGEADGRGIARAAKIRRRAVTVAGTAAALAGLWGRPGAWSQDSLSAADRSGIRDVITRQIDAFRADDGERAFGYASPGIRQMFGTADAFMAMVRSGYRPVYRPRRFDFAGIQAAGDQYIQRVRIVGPDGIRVTALYVMEQQADGGWRIAGCHLVEDEDDSV